MVQDLRGAFSFVITVLQFKVLTLKFSFDKCNETKELCVAKGRGYSRMKIGPSVWFCLEGFVELKQTNCIPRQ